MRKILFNLLLLVLAVFWQTGRAQNHVSRITMSFENEPLPEVFRRIEKVSDFKFLFTYDDVQNERVTTRVKNLPVLKVVEHVLQQKPFSWKVNGKFITITKKQPGKYKPVRQQQRIAGKVFETNTNEPVVGARLQIVGSNIYALSDAEGNFSLMCDVDPSVRVQVSYIGMKSVVLPVQANMRIGLTPDTHELQGVVVTGIFRKVRESYTGAVSTIGREELERFKGSNLLQTLRNIDASINFAIDNTHGSNPNSVPNLNIRGTSSLPMSVEAFNQGEQNNPNTPLIVMDGFEISLQKLMDYNDEEIESINILKDAAATAIYGSRGANGVIVVVSRQPEPGRLHVNMEVGTQFEIPDLSSYHLLNAAQKLELEKRAGLYDKEFSFAYPNGDLSRIEAYEKRHRAVLSGIDTDWLAKPLQLGVGQRYGLRLEGGDKTFRWSVDTRFNHIEGAMKGSNRKTFTGGITLLYKYKSLTFRNYSAVTLNRSQESPYGSFSKYVVQQPYNAPYDADGNIVKFFDGYYVGYANSENPMYNALLGSFDKGNYHELTNNFSVEWNILPELVLRGQLGISMTNSESHYFRSPKDTYYENDTSGEYSTGSGFLRKGFYRYGNDRNVNVNADATLSYNKVFGNIHTLYAGLNASVRQYTDDNFTAAFEGISNSAMAKIANARQYAVNEMPSGSNVVTRQLSLTGNLNYTLAGKYYADVSYRMDGNSTYGSKRKFAPFYSVGAGWNIHHERFLKKLSFINMLRLKASHGETGAASGALQTDAYTYYNYITDNRYMSWTGATLGGFGNERLSWQTTRENNIGTEFGLWNNRVKGSFDFYTKTTNNLLSSMDLPLASGFASYRANIGSVRNVGWEAALQVFAVRNEKHGFSWLLGAQLVHNNNRITHLSQAIKDQTEAYMLNDVTSSDATGIMTLFYEGRPQNAIYAVRSLGIDPSTGREIYLDKNGNITDVWKASDKVYCGNADPTYRGNFNTMVQWKNLSVTASFGYYWGGQMFNATLLNRVEVTPYTILKQNVDERVLTSRWYTPGDVVFFKGLSSIATRATSRYVMNNNVLELQSVSVQYKLKNQFLSRHLGLNTCIVSVNMNDLFHWGSIRMERGTNYPFARNVMAGVKLLF